MMLELSPLPVPFAADSVQADSIAPGLVHHYFWSGRGPWAVDVLEADAFGDELLQRQPALQVETDQGGEVALGQAVAVPRRLQRTAAGEEVDQGHLQCHVRCRNTHQHNGSG